MVFSQPIRVLDVPLSLEMGGIAHGIVQVLQHFDGDRFRFDFLVREDVPRDLEPQVEALGGCILRCPHPRRAVAFARSFAQTLRAQRPYDILHTHPYLSSGFMLALGARHKIPVRLAHAHNDRRHLISESSLHRKLYTRLMRSLIRRYATGGIAISPPAGDALFHANWQSDPNYQLIPVGQDFSAYETAGDRAFYMNEFGLRQENIVLAAIGRFMPQKNHVLIMDIFKLFHATHPNAKLLLIGEGPLEAEVRQRVAQEGLSASITFAGVRKDCPEILTSGAVDALLFPSLHEGLGRIAIEGQAAGVPVLASEAIPKIADIYEHGVTRLPLSAPPEEWVKALETLIQKPRIDREEALRLAQASPFNIQTHVQHLTTFYDAQLEKMK